MSSTPPVPRPPEPSASQRPEPLLIDYASLAAGGSERLALLAAIGQLLAEPTQEHALSDLLAHPDIVRTLRDWLANAGQRFWRVEDERVTSSHPCPHHVLIGTRQLMADLAHLRAYQPAPSLAHVDTIWQAAAQMAADLIHKGGGDE